MPTSNPTPRAPAHVKKNLMDRFARLKMDYKSTEQNRGFSQGFLCYKRSSLEMAKLDLASRLSLFCSVHMYDKKNRALGCVITRPVFLWTSEGSSNLGIIVLTTTILMTNSKQILMHQPFRLLEWVVQNNPLTFASMHQWQGWQVACSAPNLLPTQHFQNETAKKYAWMQYTSAATLNQPNLWTTLQVVICPHLKYNSRFSPAILWKAQNL